MMRRNICSKSVTSLRGQGLLAFLLLLLMAFGFNVSVKAADTVPTVEKIQIINSQDIEIYWSEEMSGAGWVESQLAGNKLEKQEQNFSVTVDGTQRELNYWCFEDAGNYEYKGVVYYNTKNSFYPDNPDCPKTTLRLAEPITDLNNLPEITVTIKGNKVKGKLSDAYVPQQTLTVNDYVPFYQKERTLNCGVKVVGTAKVLDEAMDKAAEMLDVLLAKEDIASRMGSAGCMLGLYGEGEIAYDIPEHRFEYDENYLYVEGFGGTQLASIRDANVLRLKTGSYTTGYRDESILTHEFAHTVYNYGLSAQQQAEFLNIYNASISAGKWPNSYAGSNKDEYFATLSAIWFNAMDDTYDGEWDGVRGPINTRAELKVYDRAAYDFLSEVYVSDRYLPSPWQNGSVPDNYTYPGTDPGDNTNPGGNTDPGDNTNPGGSTNPGDNTNPGGSTKPGETTEPGNNHQPAVNKYKVKFVFGNGKADLAKTVKNGSKVSAPSSPKKKGYIFKGWYLGTKKYSFHSKVTKNITLQAKWDKVKAGKASIKSLKVQKGKKLLVTIKKSKQADGYKITYAKNKKLTKSKKIIYTLSIKKTITKLKKGTYYVGVQAYRKDSAGKKVLGKMSAAKKVIIKR